VISVFARNIIAGKPLAVNGDGTQTRDLSMCAMLWQQYPWHAESGRALGKAVNIGRERKRL